MHTTANIARTAILALCIGAAGARFCAAGVTNITHPGYYTTITGAVVAASNGDTLLVSTGLYAAGVNIYNKTLTIDGRYDLAFAGKVAGSTVVSPLTPNSCFDITNAIVALVDIECRNGGTSNVIGGGIDIRDSIGTLESCRIQDNVAYVGGGLYVQGSMVLLTNTPVHGNTAVETVAGTGYGGGIMAVEGSTVTIRGNGSGVYDNHALLGGGICAVGSMVTIEMNADVYRNTALRNGGGILLQDGATCTVRDNASYVGFVGASFGQNVASNGSGGGIYAADSTLAVRRPL